MNKKYSQDEVEQIFLNNGLILCDKYINNKTPLYCKDEEGYKYQVALGDALCKKGHKFVHSKNPHSIDNIKRFIINNNLTISLLSDSYTDNKTKLWWRCECGKHFQTSWDEMRGGKHFCNFCAKSKRFDGLRDYYKEVKEECEKRGYVLLTTEIKRSMDKFQYICKKHSDMGIKSSTYDQMINCHRGCRECGIISRGEKHRLDESVYKAAVEKVGFIYMGYDYNNSSTKYKKANIYFICPRHKEKGIQRIKFNNLQRSVGRCKYCCGYGRTQLDLQRELDEMHGLVEILTYKDYSSPIEAKCRTCGHVWITSGSNLTNNHKCPNCAKSNFELEVSKILDKYNYKYLSQYKYDDCRDKLPLPFDFYLKEQNILIEADGEGHYKPIPRGSMTDVDAKLQLKVIQYHDEIKTKYCKNKNIPLIRIPYWERNNLECFLINEISKIA